METFFDSQRIYAVLDGFNPWWKGPTVPVPEYRRLAYYACRRFMDDPALKRAVLLSGAWRVGKTTVLLQVASALVAEGREPKSILYPEPRSPGPQTPFAAGPSAHLSRARVSRGRLATLLLDEVHYSPDWELYVKHLVDRKPFYRILTTGSASVIHRQRLAESGVGRWIRVPMPTLSFYEFAEILGDMFPDLPAGIRLAGLFESPEADLWSLGARLRPLMPLFQRYLLVGGFPDTARLSDLALGQRLIREDVVERILNLRLDGTLPRPQRG